MTTEFKDCGQCFWAALGLAIYPSGREEQEWSCQAPEVVSMLSLGSSCIPSSYPRAFSTICGSAGRFFVQRRPGNQYINACLIEDNYEALPDALRDKSRHAPDILEEQ